MLNPTDRSTEANTLFHEHEMAIRLKNTTDMSLVAAIGMMVGSYLDYFVYPEHLWGFFWIRSASSMLLVSLFVLIKYPKLDRVKHALLELLAFVPLGAILWMIYETEGVKSTYYAGLNLVFVGMAVTLWWPLKSIIIQFIFTFVGYVVIAYVQDGTVDNRLFFNNLYFMILTSIFVLIGSHLYQKSRYKEFMLSMDLSEAKKQLEENHFQLQELDEAKTQFFANISHELRTPLTVILGTIETIQERREAGNEDEQSKMLSSVQNNGLRLLGLIDNLLDLVKFDQGQEKLSPQAIETSVFLKGLVGNVIYLAERKSIKLRYEGEEKLPALLLDTGKLEKIIYNLLINSIKFTEPAGFIIVKANYANGYLTFTVEDNGIGMSEEKLANVFQRFWQADSSMNRKFRGSGIGLSLTKNLIDVMGGEVTVESEEGEGTEFKVVLPVVEASQSDVYHDVREIDAVQSMHKKAQLVTAASDELARPLTKAVMPSEKSDMKILIADDEPQIRSMLADSIKKNHDVIEAADGQEAFDLVEHYRPDIVLLDYMMPEMTGLEVCKKLRADDRFLGLPIIILTARADDSAKIECLTSGASDYISKPCSMAELRLRVETQVSVIRFQRELKKQNSQLKESFEKLQEKEVELLRHEKLSSLGRMSAGIIHEINNPLNYVSTSLHLLAMHEKSLPADEVDDFHDSLKDAKEGLSRVVQIVSDLRSFTQADSQSMQQVELLDVIEGAQHFISDQLNETQICEIDVAADLQVLGNRNQLIQVFINFFQNSFDAIRERRELENDLIGEICISARPSIEANCIDLYFKDNGCGISKDAQDKIFDPFYSGKAEGEGMGLGLSIVYQIFERHKIEVSVDSCKNDYTCFQLTMPTSHS